MDSKTTQVIRMSAADISKAIADWVSTRFGPGAWTVKLDATPTYLPGPGEYPTGYRVSAEASRIVEESK